MNSKTEKNSYMPGVFGVFFLFVFQGKKKFLAERHEIKIKQISK